MSKLKYQLEKIHPQFGDIILMKFNLEEIDLDCVVQYFNELKELLPYNKIISIPNGIELSVTDKNKIIEYLNNEVNLN